MKDSLEARVSTKRDYHALERRIKSIVNRSEFLDLEVIAHIGERNLPLYVIKTIEPRSNQTICISAGVHGNEPEGIYGLLEFLERHSRDGDLFRRFNFIIFPVVNPLGYVVGKRFIRINVNRYFGREKRFTIKEVDAITAYLADKKINLFLDLHEDVDVKDFYVYERRRKGSVSLGRRIVQAVNEEFSILKLRNIYGEPACQGVVRSVGKEFTFEEYMFSRGARYAITAEVPGINSRNKRDSSVGTRAAYLTIQSLLQGFLAIQQEQKERKRVYAR